MSSASVLGDLSPVRAIKRVLLFCCETMLLCIMRLKDKNRNTNRYYVVEIVPRPGIIQQADQLDSAIMQTKPRARYSMQSI